MDMQTPSQEWPYRDMVDFHVYVNTSKSAIHKIDHISKTKCRTKKKLHELKNPFQSIAQFCL